MFKDRNRRFAFAAIILTLVLVLVIPAVLRGIDSQRTTMSEQDVNSSISGQYQTSGDVDVESAIAEAAERDQSEPVLEKIKFETVDPANDKSDNVGPDGQGTFVEVEANLPSAESIAAAKAKEKALLLQNIQRQQKMLEELKNRESELKALLRTDVFHAIERWRSAWESGDIDRYLSSYVDNYVPGVGVLHADWKKQREARVPIKEPSSRKIKLSAFKLSFGENHTLADVYLMQDYQSERFSDSTKKQLVLRKVGQNWLIVKEQILKG